MSEKEISILAEETREWLRRQRSLKGAERASPSYEVDGKHVTVGPDKPLADRFLSAAEASRKAAEPELPFER